jgi:hypothetical protein
MGLLEPSLSSLSSSSPFSLFFFSFPLLLFHPFLSLPFYLPLTFLIKALTD